MGEKGGEELNEHRLIKKNQRTGDRNAADEFIRVYYDDIHGYVKRQVSDEDTAIDLTQEIFISMLKTIQYYDRKKGAKFRTWLYRIATNKIIDWFRSSSYNQIQRTIQLNDVDPVDDNDFTIQLEHKFVLEQIGQFVGSYPAPFLSTDRMCGVNHLQYSSHIGRKFFSIQFVVTIMSTILLSTLFIVLAYIPFMANGAIDYWHASIMAFHPGPGGLWLYDITFGQYAYILAGIVILFNLCAASLTFVLARFSQNIIVMMMKIVPFCMALAGMFIISVNDMFSDENLIFNLFFQGKVRFSEIWFGTALTVVGLVIVWYLTKREKQVDV